MSKVFNNESKLIDYTLSISKFISMTSKSNIVIFSDIEVFAYLIKYRGKLYVDIIKEIVPDFLVDRLVSIKKPTNKKLLGRIEVTNEDFNLVKMLIYDSYLNMRDKIIDINIALAADI